MDKKGLTVSHVMVLVILIVYIAVAIFGITLITSCFFEGQFETGVQGFITLCSYCGICGSSTIIVYTTKAAKENEIKITNSQLKMKTSAAKEIHRDISDEKLDSESIMLVKTLTDGTDCKPIEPTGMVLAPIQEAISNIPEKNSHDDGLG